MFSSCILAFNRYLFDLIIPFYYLPLNHLAVHFMCLSSLSLDVNI